MAYNEAKKASNNRYLEKFHGLTVRLPLEEMDAIRAAAAAAGESLAGFVARSAVDRAHGAGQGSGQLVPPEVLQLAEKAAEAEGVELGQWIAAAITSKEQTERGARGLRAAMESLRKSRE